MNNLEPIVIFQASSEATSSVWQVEDDVVMGGRSAGQVEMTEEGHMDFHGEVSLENNGGFSSILYELPQELPVSDQTAFHLRLRGDGSTFTFRVRSAAGDGFYHQADFPTNGEWETIAIPFDAMKAVHHGEPVNVPNYAGEKLKELQLLIGNGKAQTFRILLGAVEAVG